ncbi:MAG: hypothetical protein KatS3mg102_1779 [Planctomycetota bacterium]|nr:MAG: hypothetical protein KatS3mg102_1779 [Planctomycetota bacterium]
MKALAVAAAAAEGLGRWVLDLLLPPCCAGCGGALAATPPDGVPGCAACRNGLAEPLAHQCRRCGARLPGGRRRGRGRCAACRQLAPAVPPTAVLGPYAGRLRALVRALKYRGATAKAPLLGALLAARVRERGLRADLVVPVPGAGARVRRRGLDHAALLAQALAEALGLRCAPRALVRVRNSPPLFGLGRAARRAALLGAFRAEPALVGGRRVLLVDDVLTSGATLAACAEALGGAGARAVAAACVARRQRRCPGRGREHSGGDGLHR